MMGHIKCTTEEESWKIKISARVLNDLNEFINQKFTEAEESDESQGVDAFDYVVGAKSGDTSKKKISKSKLSKAQKNLRTQFLTDSQKAVVAESSSSE